MPDAQNDQEPTGLVPPLKVMRRRLGGVYRADSISGPTRRYILVVGLLVVLASLPTLAAITAGPDMLNTEAENAAPPFLPQPSSGPVVVPSTPTPAPSASASASAAPPAAAPGAATPQRTKRSPTAGSTNPSRSTGSGAPGGSTDTRL